MREIEILFGLEDDQRVGLGEAGKWREALQRMDGSASKALQQAEARMADRPTLKEAVEAWLYRTPIRGSSPTQAGDEEVVDGFVRDYLARVREGVESQMAERLDARLDEDAKAGVRARYALEIQSAEAWLSPEDPRRRRVRAAILFIESYRALPLLSWPREILDRVVEAEQALLVFRQRHARMVERIIGRRVGTGGTSGVEYLDETALAYRVFEDLWEARTFLLPRGSLPPLEETAYYEFPTSAE
jgi:tryptophan 2,3-dioxygenase